MSPWPLLALAYLLGSIPSSLWIGQRVYGVDLRQEGSGNLGATNALRVYGGAGASAVLLADVAKGWVPVAVFPGWLGGPQGSWPLIFGGAAILGHMFSVWARFRGGKGVATSAGVLLALAPGALGLALGVWLTVLAVGRMVSLASLLAAACLPVLFILVHPGPEPDAGVLWFVTGLAALVIWAHRANLRRIAAGVEPRVGHRMKREGKT